MKLHCVLMNSFILVFRVAVVLAGHLEPLLLCLTEYVFIQMVNISLKIKLVKKKKYFSYIIKNGNFQLLTFSALLTDLIKVS